jgi:hypothetical protein
MRRFVLLSLALALMVSAEAGAKGPIYAKVCGANGCQEIESLRASRALTMPVFRAQGRPDPPPSASSGWFAVTMRFGDFPERFALLQDPDYIRAVGKREGIVAPGEKDGVYGWLRLTPAEARAHRSLTEGLEPLPISELPHLRATAPDLAVTVRAAEATEGGKAATTLWLALGAAVASLVAVGFVLSRRRRRPGPQPAL